MLRQHLNRWRADIMFDGTTPGSSFTAPVDAGTVDSATATERLVGGRCKIAFTGWFDDERFWLWYTRPTTAPPFDSSEAAWYSYDGSKEATIAFTGTAVEPTETTRRAVERLGH